MTSLRRVLVVEDDPAHAFLMKEQLSPHGAEVDNVDSVAGAIRTLGEGAAYDLVLLDQDLPDGVGFEVQQFLKARADAPPVIFVTSDDQVEHVVRAMREGARGYVLKRPDYLGELEKEVVRVLHSRGASAQNRSEYEARERRKLGAALERNDWNVSATARELGIGRGKLRSRMTALGIDD